MRVTILIIFLLIIFFYCFIVKKLLKKLKLEDNAKDFTIISIIILSTLTVVITVAFGITTNYLAVIVSIFGLMFFNHSIQPFFSPLIVEKQSKDIYLTRFTGNLSTNGDFNLYKTDTYVIKLPLIAIFKKIKIPAGHGPAISDYIRNHTDPFSSILEPSTDSIIIELNKNIDAWLINKIDRQISYACKIEDSVIQEIDGRKEGPIGIRQVVPLYETTHFGMISENGVIIGVLIEAFNPLSIPFKIYHQIIENFDFWEDINRNRNRIYYENHDEIGIFDGCPYCIIADLGPYERRSYYMYSNRKSWCVANGKKFMDTSSFKDIFDDIEKDMAYS